MHGRILCVLLLFGINLASPEECQHCNASMPLQFSDIVPKDYDKSKPPLTADGGPTVVRIKVSVLNIQFVDEEMQTFGADLFIHQYWKDNRVKIPEGFTASRIVVDAAWRKKLWTPDTYFKNLLDGKVNDIIIPYSYAKLDNNSELFFANRVTLKLICPMNLATYPHDVQECEISIMSLQHATSTVVLEWNDFEVTKTILLAQYHVTDRTRADCTKNYPDIGEFSCLRGRIKLSRRLGYFLINKYIPCILIVCMSFVTFSIPAEAYPARVTLSVTSLLTIVTQQYQKSTPSVSYVVALNIWMLSCIGFVFLSLLEYAFVVAVMNQKGSQMWLVRMINRFCPCAPKSSTPADGESCQNPDPSKLALNGGKPPARVLSHLAIDKASRIVFPLLFFIFCISYTVTFAR